MNVNDKVIVISDAYKPHGIHPGMCGRVEQIYSNGIIQVVFDIINTSLVMYDYHVMISNTALTVNVGDTVSFPAPKQKPTANDPKLPPNDKKFVDKEKMWEITQSICKGT